MAFRNVLIAILLNESEGQKRTGGGLDSFSFQTRFLHHRSIGSIRNDLCKLERVLPVPNQSPKGLSGRSPLQRVCQSKDSCASWSCLTQA